jgi:hypothetical protein
MISNSAYRYGTVELTLSIESLDALSRLLYQHASSMPLTMRLELDNLRAFCDTELLRLREPAANTDLTT